MQLHSADPRIAAASVTVLALCLDDIERYETLVNRGYTNSASQLQRTPQ